MNAYIHNSAYLIEQDGNVAVYRGIPEPFLLLSYSELVEETDIPVDELSPGVADRIREGLRVDDVQAAQDLIEEYRSQLSSEGEAVEEGGSQAGGADAPASGSSQSGSASDGAGSGSDGAGSHGGSSGGGHSGSNAVSPDDVVRSGEGA